MTDGINSGKPFHHVSKAGNHSRHQHQSAPEGSKHEDSGVLPQFKGERGTDVLNALNQAGSNALNSVASSRIEKALGTFPSPEAFSQMVQGFSPEELNHPLFASIISDAVANQLIGKPAIVS